MDLKHIYDPVTCAPFGQITAEQLQFLIDHLEEEGVADQDYAITGMTIALLEGEGGDPELIQLLRKTLGDKEEVVIAWDD